MKFVKLLWRYVFYLGITILPLLLGWGIDDVGGFFRDPARTGYVALVVLGSLAIFVPRLSAQPFGKGSQVVGCGLLRVYMVSGFFFLLFFPFADRRGLLTFADGAALRWAGFALCLAGSVIRLAGFWSLGKQFSGYVTVQDQHQLVQAGLYSRVRHPMYLGAVVAMTGMGLVFRSWLVFVALAWNLTFVLLRIGQEERLLAEHFGADFESYRRHTWRLLPYVY